MIQILMIAAGGASGALLRYAISGWVQTMTNGSFPAGTLLVNVLGSALFGLAAAFFAGPNLVREEYRVALLVGVLGAFTTFSTFGWETLVLVRAGQLGYAATNILLSNGIGLGAVWLGYRLGQQWYGAHDV